VNAKNETASMSIDGDEKTQYENDIKIMLDKNTSNSVLRKSFHNQFDANMHEVGLTIMENEKCPPDVMEHIARHGDEDARFLVLGGSCLPSIKAIDILLENDSEDCRAKIFDSLSDRWISPKLTKELLKSRHEILRLSAVSNPYIDSPRIYESAASDESALVRLACAESSNCPGRVLEKLITDQDPRIRAAVATNCNLQKSTVRRHYKDSDRRVQLGILQQEDCPVEAITYYFSGEVDEELKEAIAAHNKCPANILRILAKDESKGVRYMTALNKNTPKDGIVSLAQDQVPMIRSAAGFHEKCPDTLLNVAFMVPDVTFPSENNIDQLNKKIREIKGCHERCYLVDRNTIEYMSWGRDKIENITLAWDFEYFLAPPEYIDRTRGMLAGPFYTSKSFPWPKDVNNNPAEPIIQVDLDEISRVRGKSYDSGLLQVFADDGNLITRVIPRQHVDSDELTYCEWDFSIRDNHSFYQFLESRGENYKTVIRQIVGYKSPYISSELQPYEGDEECLSADFWKLNELLSEIGDECTENHLFGTYHEIQSREHDGELLISLDEKDEFVWGDSGNAQVFVNIDEHGCKYLAQWSCY
jgi:hypothetical protein